MKETAISMGLVMHHDSSGGGHNSHNAAHTGVEDYIRDVGEIKNIDVWAQHLVKNAELLAVLLSSITDEKVKNAHRKKAVDGFKKVWLKNVSPSLLLREREALEMAKRIIESRQKPNSS